MSPTAPRRLRRTCVATASALIMAAAALTSCANSGPGDPAKHPAIRTTAEAFAAAAPNRSLDHVPLTSDVDSNEATRRLAILLAGTENLTGRGVVTAIEPYTDDAGDHARATLHYTWSVQTSEPWEYDATLQLDRVDDAWLARYRPEAVVPQLQPGERLVVTTTPAPHGQLLATDRSPLPTSLVNNRPIIGGPGAPPSNGAYQALFGGPALRIDAVGKAGRRAIFSAPARAGTTVVSTVDPVHHKRVAAALGRRKSPSSVVVLDPRSGAILALGTGGGSKEENLATRGLMAPGGAFSPVTALAAVRAGVAMKRRIPCPPSLVIGAEPVIADPFPGAPPATAAEVLSHGCTTGMALLAQETSTRYLAEGAAALGLNALPALGISAAVGGLPSDGGGPSNQLNSAGEGQVRVSPLGMAVMLGSIVQGSAVAPMLVAPEAMPSAVPTPSDVATSNDPAARPRLTNNPKVDVVTPGGRIPGSTPKTNTSTAPSPASVTGPMRPLTAGEAVVLRSLFGERMGRPSVGPTPQATRLTVLGTSYDEQKRPYAWAVTATADKVVAVLVAGEQPALQSALPLLRMVV